MKRVILCRHAETDTNSRGVMHQTNDPIGLSPLGITQAKQLGHVLKQENAEIIISSTEARALLTAKTAIIESQVEIIHTKDLHERNWGEWGGRPWGEIQTILEPMTLEERYTFSPPKGESWQDFENRLRKSFTEIESLPYETVAVITHGGTLRALMPILKNEPKETSFKYDFHNASVSIFNFENGEYTEVIENDISHLSING